MIVGEECLNLLVVQSHKHWLSMDMMSAGSSDALSANNIMLNSDNDDEDDEVIATESSSLSSLSTVSIVSDVSVSSASSSLVAAVQETHSSHAGQTAVYSGTADVTPNASNTASSQCHQSTVTTSTHSQPSSSQSSVNVMLDFTSVEIPEWEYPANLRGPEYDAVVISTEEENDVADVFRNILRQFVTLEVCFTHSF